MKFTPGFPRHFLRHALVALSQFMCRGFVFLLLVSGSAAATVKHAQPENYRRLLTTLKPGDTLVLAAGVYERGLPVSDSHGTPEAWITIQGPEEGVAEIRQTQVANCVELKQCSHVALKKLSILGGGPQGISGLFGISAQGGLKNSVHHILIEDCIISDWNTSQQAVGISTKTPTWDWTIRRNIIRNCGTGLYLGNSNGADPFIRGVIEHNLVQDPIGYCMEIKFQKTRPVIDGMPTTASRTIIRHNVFIKNDAPSPDGDRANLLVGGFPDSGPGSDDLYEIYGNFLWHNPRESLLQASGRVSIHDNVFADCPANAAITVRNHDLPVKLAHIYNNTIYAAARGIRIASAATDGAAIIGNVVFAGEPLSLHNTITNVRENVTGPVADAALHLANPQMTLGSLDLHPKLGSCEGTPLDLSSFADQTAFDLDFSGAAKGERRIRGAYASPATKTGWMLQGSIKPPSASKPKF
ncbi:right-handed parallel beta-helix repeat-containing protein [Prosthecobacter sp.]|uniref:right-handed parallel beta-helix repeat-containing protein n=1 Tax=Prosthecobacter sp. TaxID=1965333 RepID=UPI002ABADCFE|nr:right-handed parallel beta-helix repeat-containing protein [Prosthecobacter sp.]MDZ4402786.1 right-handed parallel beta-helix repeat-containing protein [Prosthecobacter sp.]